VGTRVWARFNRGTPGREKGLACADRNATCYESNTNGPRTGSEELMFNYQSYLEWLQRNLSLLTMEGFSVELEKSAEYLASVVLKVGSSSIEAELTVWENGHTSAMIYDLESDRYLLDRHDLVLDSNFCDELRPFFDIIMSKRE
jgi:hypothetical protein